MTINDLLKDFYRSAQRFVLPLAASALVYCGGDEDSWGGCRRNTDCRSPQICVDGYCVDEGGEGEAEAEAEGEGCDDWEGRFCTCYEEVCPGSLEEYYAGQQEVFNLQGCNERYSEKNVLSTFPEKTDDFLLMHCILRLGICMSNHTPTATEETDMRSCLESYGWECNDGDDCGGDSESCVNYRCM